MPKTYAKITGVHGYVPEYTLTNKKLATMVDTNDDWITTRTGIKERRILKEKNQGSTFMAIKAVEGLLQKTSTPAHTIDLIICATVTPDLVLPANAGIIAHAVGAKNAIGYDLQAACSGFLYALETAAQYIENKKYQKIIVIGVDKMSSIVDYEDRTTCILFGDGAGALLLEPSFKKEGIINSILKMDGSGEKYLHQKAGGSRRPPTHDTIENREHYLYQDGKAVFKFAVNSMIDVVNMILKKNQLKKEAIDFLVPHQANYRIIKAIGESLALSEDKIMITIDHFGNTTAATIPLCLWMYEKKLQPGHQLILTTFGAGFTWGSMYVIW